MNQNQFIQLLTEHDLEQHAELLQSWLRPTLYLTLGEAGEQPRTTRMGGSPDVPSDFICPTDEEGVPLTFVLQVNLADIPQFEGNPFPASGLLSVFVGLDEPASDVLHRVFLFPDPAECEPRSMPSETANETFAEVQPHGLNVTLGVGLPRWATSDEEQLLESILEADPDLDEDDLHHICEDLTNDLEPSDVVARLLGHAAGIGHDPREEAYVVREHNPAWLYNAKKRAELDMEGAKRWLHFLTIDSCTEAGLCIWDAGYLQFLVKDTDLATLNLENMYASVETS